MICLFITSLEIIEIIYNNIMYLCTSLFFFTIGCYLESSCDASLYDAADCNYDNSIKKQTPESRQDLPHLINLMSR